MQMYVAVKYCTYFDSSRGEVQEPNQEGVQMGCVLPVVRSH